MIAQTHRVSSAAGGDYFSRAPSVPIPTPHGHPPFRHTQSSSPPIPRKQHLSESSAPIRLTHSFPVPNVPYPYASPSPSQGYAPYAAPHQPYVTSQSLANTQHGSYQPHTAVRHPHHSLPTPSRHPHTDYAPGRHPHQISESPKPALPPKPPLTDEDITRVIQTSLQETRTPPQQYDEDAALARALKQSLTDVGRSYSPPHRPPSSVAPSSSGHSASTDSGYHTASSSSPFASPRHSSAPHPAFFPGHRSRGSSITATPPHLGTLSGTGTDDTAQALRMRSTSIETSMPKDVRRRSESANRDKLAQSAPPADQIPHVSHSGHARLTKRPTPSQNESTQGQASQRLSVAVDTQKPARATEPQLAHVLDTPIVASPSPSPGRQDFDVDDAPPPSYHGPGPGMINEKDGLLSAASAEESGSSTLASPPQQHIPQELLTGICEFGGRCGLGHGSSGL